MTDASPRRRGRLVFRAAAAVIAIVVALCTGEVVARAVVGDRVVFNRLDRWQPDEDLGRILRANHSFEASGVPYEVNALHLRDHEYAVAKPDGTFRVMVVGDSFVYGIGPLETIFPKVLEARLRTRTDGAAEVLAVGCPGFGTIQQNRFVARFLREHDADLVVLAFCVGNDITENARFMKREHLPDRSRKDDEGEGASWLEESSRLYQLWLARKRAARKADETRFLGHVRTRMRLADRAAYTAGGKFAEALDRTVVEIRAMRDDARRRGADFVVLLLPEEYQLDEDLRRRANEGLAKPPAIDDVRHVQTTLAARLAAEEIPVLDPFERFADGYTSGRLYLPRDTHFDAEGNARTADALEAWIVARYGERPVPGTGIPTGPDETR